MSHPYTPSATQLVSITVPDDGVDQRNAASVNTPMQSLADGIAFLNPISASYLVPLADLTALAAIAAPADGTIRHVLGFGMFVFKTSATIGLSPFRVAATDATVGGWLSSTNHQASLTKYLPLNGNVRLSQAIILASVGLSVLNDFTNPTASQAVFSERGFYSSIVYTAGAGSNAWAMPIDAGLIDGATLATATLYFRPVGGHAALPPVQPWLGIVAIDRAAYNPMNLKLKSGTTGFSQLAAANVAAYQVDQALVFTPNQNALIDLTQYAYMLVIGDEGGSANALAGNRYASLGLSMTSIPDARR
jgi:hypothetical protein